MAPVVCFFLYLAFSGHYGLMAPLRCCFIMVWRFGGISIDLNGRTMAHGCPFCVCLSSGCIS
jgi:hypothetical protein